MMLDKSLRLKEFSHYVDQRGHGQVEFVFDNDPRAVEVERTEPINDETLGFIEMREFGALLELGGAPARVAVRDAFSVFTCGSATTVKVRYIIKGRA